jgi:CheY-like chemotaxis protein
MKKTVLIADDDPTWLENTAARLREEGIEVVCVDTDLSQALETIASRSDDLAAVVLDVYMLRGRDPAFAKASPHDPGGLAAARVLRLRYPELPLIGVSRSPDEVPTAQAWFLERGGFDWPVGVFTKTLEESLLIDLLCKIAGQPRGIKRIFLVHGHDHKTLDRTIEWVRAIPGFEPVTIRDGAAGGMTWIEQLERLAERAFMAWILLTPDDEVGSKKARGTSELRARQNVILELGFFLGKFGRKSSRVLLLLKTGVDLPSDLQGIRHIKLGDNFEDFLRELYREIGPWLPPISPPTPPPPPAPPELGDPGPT